MRCAGCNRTLEVGDRYITDTASAFTGREDDSLDSLMAELMGCGNGKIVYCEDCTQDGGDWMLDTVYGDEGEA